MYSNSIVKWTSGETVTVSSRRGWDTQLWTALSTTTTEPTIGDVTWQLDTPIKFMGVRLLAIPDNRNFLKTKITGITLMEPHVSNPPEVRFTGITLIKQRLQPYLISVES